MSGGSSSDTVSDIAVSRSVGGLVRCQLVDAASTSSTIGYVRVQCDLQDSVYRVDVLEDDAEGLAVYSLARPRRGLEYQWVLHKTSITSASLPLVTHACSLFSLGSSLVLVGGGPNTDGATSDAFCYAVDTSLFHDTSDQPPQWRQRVPPPVRVEYAGCVVVGSTAHLLGGVTNRMHLTFSLDGGWERLPDMPLSAVSPGVLSVGGYLVVIGGQGHEGQIHVYERETCLWTKVNDAGSRVSLVKACMLDDTTAVVHGTGGTVTLDTTWKCRMGQAIARERARRVLSLRVPLSPQHPVRAALPVPVTHVGCIFLNRDRTGVSLLLNCQRRREDDTVVLSLMQEQLPPHSQPPYTQLMTILLRSGFGATPPPSVTRSLQATQPVTSGHRVIYSSQATAWVVTRLTSIPSVPHKTHTNTSLQWVSLESLREVVLGSRASTTSSIETWSVYGTSTARVSQSLSTCIRDPTVRECLSRIGQICPITSLIDKAADHMSHVIGTAMSEAREIVSLSRDELVVRLYGPKWTLSLAVPVVPPRPLLQTVTPGSIRYRDIVACLPEWHQQIYGVRAVIVPARQAVFEQQKRQLTANGELLGVYDPLYHGTPDVWRATQIALHGFDRSKVVRGSGMYTTTDVNTALSYTQGSIRPNTYGSLTILKGLQTNDVEHDSATIHIFQDPANLLCVATIDFGEDTSNTDAEEEAARERLMQHQREIERVNEAIMAAERQFRVKTMHRMRVATAGYLSVLGSLQDRLSSNTVPLSASEFASIKTAFINEKSQYGGHLPIFNDKTEIVNRLRTHDVLLLHAPTGTGKSTHLPQYIVDEVLPDETRPVAVLQPKRVNCTSLASYIATQRGTRVGGGVGYRLGGGVHRVSEHTRIEFVTHGLFARLALHGDIVSRYCAVIVDEAHVEGSDVNECLAALRNAMRVNHTSHSTSTFKVVVCSATLLPQKQETLAHYLCGDAVTYSSLSVTAAAFPVHTIYRDIPDVPSDDTERGGMMNDSLMTATVESALQFLSISDTGSVLVFLPGAKALTDAMHCIVGFMDSDPETEVGASGLRFQIGDTRIGVLPFHGTQSREERDIVLRYTSHGLDRVVVLATNLAETGLTIPDIRCVVDTGLERVVSWDTERRCEVMTLQYASASSLDQRRGRAGRTGSGVCIRLYSEDTYHSTTKSMAMQCNPEGTCLRQLAMLDNSKRWEFLHPIPDRDRGYALDVLKRVGAVSLDGHITPAGSLFVALGVSARVGAFLLECDNSGCLCSGCVIAAVLTAGSLTLPLTVHNQESPLNMYVHPTGDHLTLLQLYNAYTGEVNKHQWCIDIGIDIAHFASTQRVFDGMVNTLTHHGYSVADSDTLLEDTEECHCLLLKALRAAFADQLATVGPTQYSLHQLTLTSLGVTLSRATVSLTNTSVLYDSVFIHTQCIMVYHSRQHLDTMDGPRVSIVSYVPDTRVADGHTTDWTLPTQHEDVESTELLVEKILLPKNLTQMSRRLRRMDQQITITQPSVASRSHAAPEAEVKVRLTAPTHAFVAAHDRFWDIVSESVTEHVSIAVPRGQNMQRLDTGLQGLARQVQEELQTLRQETHGWILRLDRAHYRVVMSLGGPGKCHLPSYIARVKELVRSNGGM
ncbi:hypothetical protein KIPB_003168 [Kipferlia bialata]|uniref:RNA helicase n=1 Tax=Kipferlia bialata TaxID=797122 RepID=A0A9K3CTC2_9EUKA|nr:hypothetical protein KIPB_003168 [Kipferlia bialata]|eukprot:g3168.t1